MSKVRAKFICRSANAEGDTNRLTFEVVTSGSAENDQFFKYTPGGEINLFVVSDETAAAFVEGEEYYVDFTPVRGAGS